MKKRGVYTLEDLRMRCYIKSPASCWEWRGAKSADGGRVWLAAEGHSSTLPRAAVMLHTGTAMAPNTLAWPTCRNKLCCNPRHMKVGTKAEQGLWLHELGTLRGSPLRQARTQRSVHASGRAHLTMELATWARESSQSGRDVAHALDCNPNVVSRARLMKTYCAPAFSSPFLLMQRALAGNQPTYRNAA